MTDPKSIVDRLRNKLLSHGYDADTVNELCGEIAQKIDYGVADIVNNYYNEAVSLGVEKHASEFIAELRPTFNGGRLEISTSSGNTDFSEPPFPMMPKLLKNAKVAKDGSLYKIIPMSADVSQHKGERKSNAVSSSTDLINSMNNSMKQQGEAARAARKSGAIPDPLENTKRFIDAMLGSKDSGGFGSKHYGDQHHGDSGSINFKTVSSKQDPSTQWIYPKRDLNFTAEMLDLNARMEYEIEELMQELVRSLNI